MLAIPSPDVLINLFASAGQALGLAAIVVGRLFWKRSQSGARNPDDGGQSARWPAWTLGTLLVLTAASFLLYHMSAIDARNQRLSAALTRPSVEGGVSVGDVSLKTLGFSDQKTHPRGVRTEELGAWLDVGESVNLVDVREPEEIETGRIAGSWHRRYPDLLADTSGLVEPGQRTVLICYSGNRSSELSDEFAERGIEASFVIGGYEKWIAEERPLAGVEGRDALRSLPEYPNRLTLLDTPDVVSLVEDEGAIFIDVRYPEDLERHALPGVVNLTIRRMGTGDMDAQLAALPDRPIVLPCYDKRSSFYAEILGLRLHRMGRDFRGRYTVPQEYSRPTNERAHVAAWKQARQSRSLLDFVAAPLGAALEWIRAHAAGGSLALAIVLLILVLRIGLLPLTVKNDRDQIVQGELAPRLRALRERFADDRPRALRAVFAAQRDAGLTPLRNFLSSLVVLVLFLVMFPVVNGAAAGSTEALLWVPALGAPDPTFLLPVLVGGLIAALILVNAARRTTTRWVTALGVGVGIGLLVVGMTAAVSFYLVVNLSLIIVQGRVLRRLMARREAPVRRLRRVPADGIVPLRHAGGLPAAGGKATRLGMLIEAGMPVPGGFVLVADEDGPQPDAAQLLAAFDGLGAERVAVRSSGVNEDGADRSYAGVFESELDVTRDGLVASVGRIRQSMSSARAAAYSGDIEERGSVVVQAMVPAEYAGVVFTEDPGCSGTMLVELVAGLGESLVSGSATPDTYRFGRRSHRSAGGGTPPMDLAPLLALAQQAEQNFGGAQDIEWAYAQGRFYVLQSRDITATRRDGDDDAALVERERHRLLQLFADARPEEVVLEQDELAELLPAPTPYSTALMESLWAPGGTVDRVCQKLGVPYDVREDGPAYVETAFGRTFVHVAESRRRRGKGLGALAAFRMARSAEDMERRFRERFAPRFLKQARLRDALDLTRLSTEELLDLHDETLDRFVAETYAQAEAVNIAAEFHLRAARERVAKRGLDPAEALAQMPQTVVNEAYGLLADPGTPVEEAVEQFLERFGHRAPHDFEMSEPRYREEPEQVRERAERLRALSQGEVAARCNGAERELGRVTQLCVDRARRFQALKEEAKHHCLHELAHLRALLVEIGGRLGLGQAMFDLTPAEVADLQREAAIEECRRTASARAAARRAFAELEVPETLTVAELETLGLVDVEAIDLASDDLRGARVAGAGDIIGRARVLDEVRDLETFESDEVLVTRCTDPDWTPLFARARGIITEVGGWLSHAAIQAREYGLPAIVGARGAMSRIRTGQLVRLGTDGNVETFDDRRSEPRLSAGGSVTVVWSGGRTAGSLRDVSRTGARLVMEEGDGPRPGTRCVLVLDDGEPLAALGVSNGMPNQVGFSFRAELPPARVRRIAAASRAPATRTA